MKNNIIIKLNSSVKRSDREKPEVIEFNTLGKMERFGDGYKISYSNNFSNGKKKLETVITVSKDNAVIERNDDYFSKISLDKGKSFYSYHTSPFGTLKVKTIANEVENNLSAEGGDLFLKYCVNLGGEYSADNEIAIHVKKV
ncbi:MAG: DUF1934 domain-containing protein [Ruminococcus sp.]|jgi:uncharacterized beta-barrel protein YwiB (DUF1934 family)|nr:DUF1934 domain-containing protein [Ruminococcus sp.]